MSLLRNALLERWMRGRNLSNPVVSRELQVTMPMFGPAQLDAAPSRGGDRRPIAPASQLAQNSDRDRVIPLTPRPAVRGYHCLTSHMPAAHRVAARNSVQPCV